MRLMVAIKFVMKDPDSEDTVKGKEIDVWASLPVALQAALTTLSATLDTKVKARYGAAAIIEGMRLEG